MDAKTYISKLGLEPHPEGGFYRETFRSDVTTGAGRACATSILFLLTSGNPSNFHRIDAEEVWFYHGGDPLTVHILDKDGSYSSIAIGPNLNAGQVLQAVIPPDVWFGSSCDIDAGFSLVGCVVVPGFTFDGFELAQRSKLLKTHPKYSEIIFKLTR